MARESLDDSLDVWGLGEPNLLCLSVTADLHP
jgi:hypothetical protein